MDDDLRLVPTGQPARWRPGAGLRSGAVGHLAPQPARALRAAAARRPRPAARGADDLGGDPAAVARSARLRGTAGAGGEAAGKPAPAAPVAPAPDEAAEAARLDAERIAQEKAAQERGARDKADAAARAAQTVELERLRDEEAAERRRREEAELLRRQHPRRSRAPARRHQPQGVSAGRHRGIARGRRRRLRVQGPVVRPGDSAGGGPAGDPDHRGRGAGSSWPTNPGADESFGQAERFRQAKQLDGAFLLLRNAAGKGSAPAALALGEMYDPATYSPETSALPAPNPAQAARVVPQAAEGGIAEAQYRLGQLLLSGKTDEPNGPELGDRLAAQGGRSGAPGRQGRIAEMRSSPMTTRPVPAGGHLPLLRRLVAALLALLMVALAPLPDAGAQPSGGGRKPLLIEGKKTLYQRVLTRPGAAIAAKPGGAGGKELRR